MKLSDASDRNEAEKEKEAEKESRKRKRSREGKAENEKEAEKESRNRKRSRGGKQKKKMKLRRKGEQDKGGEGRRGGAPTTASASQKAHLRRNLDSDGPSRPQRPLPCRGPRHHVFGWPENTPKKQSPARAPHPCTARARAPARPAQHVWNGPGPPRRISGPLSPPTHLPARSPQRLLPSFSALGPPGPSFSPRLPALPCPASVIPRVFPSLLVSHLHHGPPSLPRSLPWRLTPSLSPSTFWEHYVSSSGICARSCSGGGGGARVALG